MHPAGIVVVGISTVVQKKVFGLRELAGRAPIRQEDKGHRRSGGLCWSSNHDVGVCWLGGDDARRRPTGGHLLLLLLLLPPPALSHLPCRVGPDLAQRRGRGGIPRAGRVDKDEPAGAWSRCGGHGAALNESPRVGSAAFRAYDVYDVGIDKTSFNSLQRRAMWLQKNTLMSASRHITPSDLDQCPPPARCQTGLHVRARGRATHPGSLRRELQVCTSASAGAALKSRALGVVSPSRRSILTGCRQLPNWEARWTHGI